VSFGRNCSLSAASLTEVHLVQLGSTTVGIQTSQGVVLAVEKRTQSPLLDSDSVEKIMEIDSHVACAMSGLTADARTMVEHARVTSQVSCSPRS
jgi:20S proteasome subunit alpha 5